MVKTYSDKLKDPRWQKKRLEIFQRDEFKCIKCHDWQTELNIHHLKYSENNPWDEPNNNLITLCKDCHDIIEYYKNNFNNSNITRIIKVKKLNGSFIMLVVNDENFDFFISQFGEESMGVRLSNNEFLKFIQI
jgi:hypothetical protein